jgi:hypothetical protein
MAYRNAPAHFHGWKDGDKYYLSIEPRGQARNEYDSSLDALREASKRKRSIKWEDPKAID